MTDAASLISSVLHDADFPHHGFARLTRPLSFAHYQAWLDHDYHGDMDYLRRHLPMKEDPRLLMRDARSAIVVTVNYLPHPVPLDDFPLKEAKIALYAKGADYHHFLKQRLGSVIARLKENFPRDEFAAFTDSAPVLERDLAARAGLGWIGKNTCLIHPKRGSLFFIAEIYTTLSLESVTNSNEPPPLMHDFCGKCTRCLDICPTGALRAPRELDARLCISYLTIEARGLPAEELRGQTDGWFFGCDLCQTVCPWNLKLLPSIAEGEHNLTEIEGDTRAARARLVGEMRTILSSSNKQLERMFRGTPLFRAGGAGLKRNALLVCGTQRLHELRSEIEFLTSKNNLRELAFWTLRHLDLPPIKD